MSVRSSSDADAVTAALDAVRERLLCAIHSDGYWEGRLSSSALSTATAVSALALAGDAADAARIASGITWLMEHQNADGGWGDTTDSPSNLATTLLALAALKIAGTIACEPTGDEKSAVAVSQAMPDRSKCQAQPDLRLAVSLPKAGQYLALRGGQSPAAIVAAIRREYGKDRTFAIPILMNCALAGLVPWQDIPGLPFELAVFPHGWYKALRLHVVSYALPALIAIGLLVEQRNPSPTILRRAIRRTVTPRVLAKLQQIQPAHGGFLEAAPLTSFVALGLTALFGRDQPVAAQCVRFLRQSQRAEGAWPIDTNLSVWLTTASVAALASAGALPRIDTARTARWLAALQHQARHPYTHAEPGGWTWTHLAGGVPDVDDTAGAIIALTELGHRDGIDAAVHWLLRLQNRDGGWPTFCRGWGKMPFDRSAPDVTAHALRALYAAGMCGGMKPAAQARDTAPESSLALRASMGLLCASARPIRRALHRGLQYLCRVQQADGSWLPLWFGNQATPGQTNPVLGTSRVLRALEVLDRDGPAAASGVQYLLASQNVDGGWGGAGRVPAVPSSVEETAVAVAALAPWAQAPAIVAALRRGVAFLLRGVAPAADRPAPIGLYFAHLWYSEQLYPLIWTLDALGRAAKFMSPLAEDRPI